MGLIVVLTRKRNVCAGAGECQDEASSAEEPEPALAPWESSAIGDVLWQLMAPFLGTRGGGGGGSSSASAALRGGKLPAPQQVS